MLLLMRRTFLLASLLFAAASFASDLNFPATREEGLETDTYSTSLPERAPGTITVRSCLNCAGIDLSVTADTKFLVGATEVTLADLRKAARDKNFMMVFYRQATKAVKRIVIYTNSPAGKTK